MEKFGVIKSIRLELDITDKLIIFFIGLGLIICFIIFPAYRGVLVYITSVLGGMATIYSAFYIGQTLKTNIDVEQAKGKMTLMQNSFDLLRQYDSPTFFTVKKYIADNIDTKIVLPDALYKKITTNKILHNSVKIYLNYFEDLSIAVQREFIDEEIVYDSLMYVIPKVFKDFEPYIKKRQDLRDKNILIEMEKLVNSWKVGQYLYSKKTIPNN